MRIRFQCSNGHRLAVPATLAGRRGRCPVCKVKIEIPAADTAEEETPADAGSSVAVASDRSRRHGGHDSTARADSSSLAVAEPPGGSFNDDCGAPPVQPPAAPRPEAPPRRRLAAEAATVARPQAEGPTDAAPTTPKALLLRRQQPPQFVPPQADAPREATEPVPQSESQSIDTPPADPPPKPPPPVPRPSKSGSPPARPIRLEDSADEGGTSPVAGPPSSAAPAIPPKLPGETRESSDSPEPITSLVLPVSLTETDDHSPADGADLEVAHPDIARADDQAATTSTALDEAAIVVRDPSRETEKPTENVEEPASPQVEAPSPDEALAADAPSVVVEQAEAHESGIAPPPVEPQSRREPPPSPPGKESLPPQRDDDPLDRSPAPGDSPSLRLDDEPSSEDSADPSPVESPSRPATARQPWISTRPGYRPDIRRVRTVRLLAVALLALTLLAMWPAVQHVHLVGTPNWACLVLFLSLLQLVYIGWMVSLPDWSTMRMTMGVFAVVTAVYALGMAVANAMGAERIGEPAFLQWGQVQRYATHWCGLIVMLSGLMTYLLGRSSTRWRKALKLTAGTHAHA